MESLSFGQLVEVHDSKGDDVLFAGKYGIVIRAALPGDEFPDGKCLGALSENVYMVNVQDKSVFYHKDLLRIPVKSGKFSRQTCKSK
tara:strand:+ start:1407 stop:1667 length:261 start_codon:yes stop_codon:yes gene_type:complete